MGLYPDKIFMKRKYTHSVLRSHGDQPSDMTCFSHSGILYDIAINKVIIMCNNCATCKASWIRLILVVKGMLDPIIISYKLTTNVSVTY